MKHYDVIAVGGGCAGVCAAIAAARQGKRTLLIEKQILLGGMATLGRIHWLEPYCDGRGRQVIGGLAKEFFDRAIACGYSNVPAAWAQSEGRLTSWFSPEAFMLELPAWLKSEGVELLLDAQVIAVRMENQRMQSITVAHMNGCEEISADGFVDATGMAHLFYLAGLPCVCGENYLTMIADTANEATLRRALEEKTPYFVRGRKNYGATLAGKGQPEGIAPGAIGDAWEQTQWVLDAQNLMRTKTANADPSEREIISLPAMPQIRMLRRINGKETFAGIPGLKAADSIGVIPDFRKKYDLFEIPFGSLCADGCDNLFAAGRCISAENDGWHVSRVIGPCCLTGEAAGIAASSGGSKEAVRKALLQNGVTLDMEAVE